MPKETCQESRLDLQFHNLCLPFLILGVKGLNIKITVIFFANIRYKQHKTDYETLPQTRPIPVPCRVSGCKCKSYHYVPKNGTQPIRCQCKHFADDHSEVVPYKCSKGCACKKFTSSYTCGCGQPTYAHKVGEVYVVFINFTISIKYDTRQVMRIN